MARVVGVSSKPNANGTSLMGLIGSCAILLAVIGPASVGTAAAFERSLSWQAVSIAVAAGSVCYVAAAMSLVAIFVGNQLGLPVQGLLLGMLFRMGLPLAAIIALSSQRTLGATIVVAYLLALIVETVLALRMAPAKANTSQPGESNLTDSKTRPSVAS